MGKRTVAKNRTRKNKSRRRRSYKGGFVQDIVYENFVREQLLQYVDMDESEERLLDNAIKVAKKKGYLYTVFKSGFCILNACRKYEYDDDIVKLQCILGCIEKNIDENDFKKTLVNFIKNNKADIKKLANKFDLNGLDDIILSRPDIICSVKLSDIKSILEYNPPDMHDRRPPQRQSYQRQSYQPQYYQPQSYPPQSYPPRSHPRTTRRR